MIIFNRRNNVLLVGLNLAYGIPEGGYIGKFIPWSDASAVDTGYSDGSDWCFQMVFCATTVSLYQVLWLKELNYGHFSYLLRFFQELFIQL